MILINTKGWSTKIFKIANARSRLRMLKNINSSRFFVDVSKTLGKRLLRFTTLILWAQRRSRLLPEGIRRTFRNLLGRILPALNHPVLSRIGQRRWF